MLPFPSRHDQSSGSVHEATSLCLSIEGLKRLLQGSSGCEGRQAVNELASLVRRGWSTTISPDGPLGPPRTLKKGVLHIAAQSGVPIVPLTISATRFISVPSWDGK